MQFFRNKRRLVQAAIHAAILSAALGIVFAERLQILDTAAKRTQTLASVLAEDAGRDLDAIRMAMADIEGAIGGGAQTDDIRRLLEGYAGAVPSVGGLFLVSPTGTIVRDSVGGHSIGLDVSDRDYFRRAQQSPEKQLVISDPIEARGGGFEGQMLAPVSRRARDPDGRPFVVTAVLEREVLQSMHNNLAPDLVGLVALIRQNGKTLVTLPEQAIPIGAQVMVPTGAATATAGEISIPDDRAETRIGSVAPVPGYPLGAYVGFSRNAVLMNEWAPTAIAICGGAGVLSLIVVLLFRRLSRSEDDKAFGELRTHEILETVGDGVIVVDEQGAVVSVNRAAGAMFLHDPDELIGTAAAGLVPERSREAFVGMLVPHHPAALQAGSTAPPCGLRGDGSEFPIEVSGKTWQEGNRWFRTLVFRDVSQREKTEELLRRAQKMEAMGMLAGGIAHDFNNLLAIIMGNLEFAFDGLSPDDPRHRRLKTALRTAQRGAELTKRMLQFARGETVGEGPVDCNEMIDGMRDLLTRSLTSRIKLVVHMTDEAALVQCVGSELEDAIINMAINARDAMPLGGTLIIETSRVTVGGDYSDGVTTLSAGDYILIEISDTGEGMNRDVLNRLFDPFFSTKSGKGTGLGLSMVYGFVQRSGGLIKVYSEPGLGTTFKIWLPAVEVTAELERKDSEHLPAVPQGAGQRVLVVDDEEHLRDILVDYLGMIGYRVEGTDSGDEALRILEASEPFDAVVSDVVMPGKLNGIDLAQIVSQRWPGTRTVLVSGFTQKTWSHSDQRTPGDIMLDKPFRRDALAQALHDLLQGSRKSAPEAAPADPA